MTIGDPRWIETHGDIHACEDAADEIARQIAERRKQEQDGGDE